MATCATPTTPTRWRGAARAVYKTALEQDPISADSIVLGPATARRLQEATGAAIVPVLDLSAMIPALKMITSAMITLVGSLADVVMHVIYTVVTEAAALLWDAFMTIVAALINVVLAIVRSGMLETSSPSSSTSCSSPCSRLRCPCSLPPSTRSCASSTSSSPTGGTTS